MATVRFAALTAPYEKAATPIRAADGRRTPHSA
jgi:hypothetical protein